MAQNIFAAEKADCSKFEDDIRRLECYDNSASPDLFESATTNDDKTRKSLLTERWELDSDQDKFIIKPYKPVYFLPVHYTRSVNQLPQTPNPLTTVSNELNIDNTEASFQLSFKTKLGEGLIAGQGDLWLGYTQLSHWQLYNDEESEPFRETNHEPEFILVFPTDYKILGYTGRMLSLSLNHQSNGREEPLSRSWNRVIFTVGLDRPDWAILVRPWLRLPERSDEEDENPGILDYIGRGEVLLVHRRSNSHQVSANFRHSFNDGEKSRGSVNLNWSYPCFDRLRCHAQLFDGYGETLIDYNHRTTSVGIGVALLEWF